MNNGLPKGMEPEPVEIQKPVKTVSLKDGNYIAAIYQAIDLVQVEIVVQKCIVIEGDGEKARVKLELEIGKEKGGKTDAY